MVKIGSFIKLSEPAQSVNATYVSASDFLKVIQAVHPDEVESCLNHFIVHNTPFVFRELPILYEQITKYISTVLNINSNDVKLIGSAKTGFSFSSPYGRIFDKGDLDFSIINPELFEKLCLEFAEVKKQYLDGALKLKPALLTFWDENITRLPINIKDGFIDPSKIPYVTASPVSSGIATSMSNLKLKLYEIHNIEISKASIRVFKDNESFLDRLRINLSAVLKKAS